MKEFNIKKLKLADVLDAAENETIRLNIKALTMEGMSDARGRSFLNRLLDRPGVRYLEIGVWQGSTFYSALFGNKPEVAVAIDNFSQFSGTHQKFMENMEGVGVPFEMLLEECFSVDLGKLPGGFNVYFYDGEHKYEDQKKALLYYIDALADTFVFVVDDYNWEDVQKGTQDAIKELGLTVVDELVVKSWNGVYAAVLKKAGR